MIKKVLISLIASSCLFASYVDEYNNRNYKKAFDLAQKECDVSCSNKVLNLIMAKSAEKLKNIDEALAAYDRVLILDENDYEARMAIANIYYENGNPELMKEELNYMLTNLSLNSEQKAKIDNMLNSLEQGKIVSKPYSFSFAIGLGYDSNPKYFNKDGKGSFSNTIDINGSYNIDLGQNYAVELIGEFYNKKYFKNRDQYFPDLSIFTAGVKPKYMFNNSTFGLKLSYDHIMLRGHQFLHNANAELFYENIVNENYLYSVSYAYTRGIYVDRNIKDLDYNHHSFEFANTFINANNAFIFTLNYDLESAKDNKISPYSKYKAYKASLEAIFPVLDNFTIKPEIALTYTKYDSSWLYNKNQKDFNYTLTNSFIYTITPNQDIELSLSFDKINSNMESSKAKNFSSFITYTYSF